MPKTILAISLLIAGAGCGGGGSLTATAGPSPTQQSITAAQVFSNQAETWTFKNGYGDLTWIDVAPQPDGSTIWHYRKNATNAYWGIGAQDAELYFDLSRIDGGWYSTGSHVLFPLGCPWCQPTPDTPQDFTFTVTPDAGKPRPYLIIGDSGTTVDTTFTDIGIPNMRWKTSMYAERGELISEQWEGPCVHEKWHFAIGLGLVKVEPLDSGDCKGLDPMLRMERVF